MNIILILCDDMGHWSMGCAGNSEIQTPNLDRMAASGMRFENFFCASPVCSPARASVLTGKIPSQHGVHDFIDNKLKDDLEYLKGQTTYVNVLTQNGYTCGISGKWHLGNAMERQMGFSHWYVYHSAMAPYYNAPMIRNGEAVTDEGYLTDLLTDDAIGFIQANAKKTFYLSVHYTAPHAPWLNCHPKEYLDIYDNCPFDSIPNEPKHPLQITTHPWPEGEERRETLKGYFAAVTAMDAGIGKILDTLDDTGLSEDTLVFFMSDNGMNMGHHGIFGKGNGTFPMNLYDTSVKVPAIAYHPGTIPPGMVSDSLLSQYDFMPTILDYANIKGPDASALPGKSFAATLKGSDDGSNESIVVYDEYGPVRMIRTHEWKYIHRYPYGFHELFDLVNDPGEKENLYNDETKAHIVEEMRAKLDSWFVKYVDPKMDGARESVTGWGQMNLPGIYGKGAKAFHQSQEDILKSRGLKSLY